MGQDVGGVQELREKFEAARQAGSAAEVREAAVSYYRARAAQGGTQASAALELGLTKWALAKWHQHHGGASSTGQARTAEAAAELVALKQEIDRLGPRSPARRFPEELKARLVEWARGELTRGVGGGAIEAELGVPWASISAWMGRRRAPTPRAASKLRPVRLVKTQPVHAMGATRLVLKTPGGFTVEGLDVAMLVEVLRQLS